MNVCMWGQTQDVFISGVNDKGTMACHGRHAENDLDVILNYVI